MDKKTVLEEHTPVLEVKKTNLPSSSETSSLATPEAKPIDTLDTKPADTPEARPFHSQREANRLKRRKRKPAKAHRVLVGLIRNLRNQDLLYRASSLSYDLLMASIPLLLLFIVVGSLFFAHPTASLYALFHLLPQVVADILSDVLRVLLQNVNAGTVGFGLVTAVWLGSNGFNKLILDVNTSLGFRIRGKSVVRRTFAIVYTVLFLTAIVLLLVLVVFSRSLIMVAERAIRDFGIRELEVLVSVLNSFLGRNLPLFFFLFTLVLFYRTAPFVSHGHVSWCEAAFGGIVAGVGIFLLTVIYGYVLDHVSRLSLYFGSLAGFLGLFFWLKYTCLILIIGAELIAEVRKVPANEDTSSR